MSKEIFIYSLKKQDFESKVQSGEIDNTRIGIIAETTEIWVKGEYYPLAPDFAKIGSTSDDSEDNTLLGWVNSLRNELEGLNSSLIFGGTIKARYPISSSGLVGAQVTVSDAFRTKYNISENKVAFYLVDKRVIEGIEGSNAVYIYPADYEGCYFVMGDFEGNDTIFSLGATKGDWLVVQGSEWVKIATQQREIAGIVGKVTTEALAQKLSTPTPANADPLIKQSSLNDFVRKDEAVDFATDLTGVVEATPEMFTYRPSAGDKSVRDESAVIRRIKGNTSVWNQLSSVDGTLDFYKQQDLPPIGYWKVYTNNKEIKPSVNNGIISIPIKEGYEYQGLIQTVDKLPTGTKVMIVTKVRYTYDETLGIVKLINGYGSQWKYTTTLINSGEWLNIVNFYTTVEKSDTYHTFGCRLGDVNHEGIMDVAQLNLYNLTQIFGAGNEPTTYEEFREYYPDAYYPYCAPEVRSMRATGVETVGFNLFDESKVFSEAGMTLTNDGWQGPVRNVYRKLWSNDFGYNGQICVYMKSLAVNGSPNYRVKFHYTDGTTSDTYSQLASTGTPKEGFAISDNGKVVDYINGYYGSAGEVLINKLCINLSHSGVRNGEYEPYEKNTLLLPEIAKYFPDGMQGIGDVCDEIIDGLAIQRCAVRAYEEGDENNAEVKTDKITTVYKLSEPIYTTIDEPLQLAYKVDDFGTEKMLSDAPSAPFKADIVYQFNAEGRIRDNSRNIARLEEQLQSAKEDIQNAGVQSDWLEDNPDSKAFIKNKPTMPTQVATAPEVIETMSTPSSMLPNVVYIVFSGLERFTLPTLVDGNANAHNVWKIIFISPTSANMTFPDNIAWKDGIAPNWAEAGGYCELTFTKFPNSRILGEWKLYK